MAGQQSEKDRKRFWRKLVEHRDAKRTMREWNLLFPESSRIVELTFKAALGEIADVVRWSGDDIPLSIHQNSNGSFSALPPAESEYDLRYDDLEADDIQLFALDWQKISETLANHFALDGVVRELFPYFWRLGSFESMGKHSTYYLCLLNEGEEIAQEALPKHSKSRGVQHFYAWCPFNNPGIFKALMNDSPIHPVVLSEMKFSDCVKKTYPRSFLFNDETFVVELPVVCWPYFHPELCLGDYFPEWFHGEGVFLPPGEYEDGCELRYVSELKTLSVKVVLEHPQVIFPTKIMSVSQSRGNCDDVHEGYLFVGNQKYNAPEIRIWDNQQDVIDKVRLEQKCRIASVSGEDTSVTNEKIQRFAIRRGIGTWSVIFDGVELPATGKQMGMFYVAYLISHAGEPAIHAVELEAKSLVYLKRECGISEIIDASTGKMTPLAADAFITEYNLSADDQELDKRLFKEERRALAIIESSASTSAKKSAFEKVQAIKEYRQIHFASSPSQADNVAKRVRAAIDRLCDKMNAFVSGERGTVAASQHFADFIQNSIRKPSADLWPRGGRGVSRKRGQSGHFVCKDLGDMHWDIT